ncbi:MAG: N-acetylmuramoyl-L-alanine amidase, partial [Myxococcota bacterium]
MRRAPERDRLQQQETASWSDLSSKFKRLRSSRDLLDLEAVQHLAASLEDFAYLHSDTPVAQRAQALLWAAWLHEQLARSSTNTLDWAMAQDAYASVTQMQGVPPKLYTQAQQAQKRIASQHPDLAVDLLSPLQPEPAQPPPAVAIQETGEGIWIDPGHGGEPGAVGCGGLKESEVVLDIALRVRRILRKRLRRVPVYLTRQDNKRLSLRQRVQMADAKGGRLLVSIHANSISGNKKLRGRVRGVETYSLSFSNRGYASRLAGRENAAGGSDFDLEKYLLADLATRANTGRSVALSRHVQQGIVSRLRRKWKDTRDLGIKRALLYVLLVRMPAVLVEVGFVSHPQEAKRLRRDNYKQAIATGIADGIVRS